MQTLKYKDKKKSKKKKRKKSTMSPKKTILTGKY